MRELISGVLGDRFGSAVAPVSSPPPKKKRPAPLSVRLSADERDQLQTWAGRTPLSTYVKSCLFDGKKPRKARNRTSVEDFETLARLLAALGKTDAFRNLDTLVRQFENGTLDLSDEHIQTILAACACVTAMRDDLMCALGLKAD